MEQLPTQTEARPRALLLGLDLGEFDPDRSMDELAALAEARGFEPAACVIQRRAAPETGTVLGEGKLAEARMSCQNLAIDLAIFDGELTGSQLRNLADALEVEVLDRTLLILEIFKSRAQTSEGKLQTELALQRYRLPRLAGLGEALSRQGGGGAGGGGARRGAGESRLELDRRHVHGRIESLERRLKELEKRRGENRRARQKGGAPVISLVGYTNVGKSTLMNLLSKSDVFAENKLFATLDTTVRKVIIDNLPFLLTDTVGFIRKLPTHLVESFKSTLDEVRDADLLVHVVDISHPNFEEQIEVVNRTLTDVCEGADKPMIMVFNKIDAFSFTPKDADDLTPATRENISLDELKETWMNRMGDDVVFISAKKGINIDELKQKIYEKAKQIHLTRFPYNDFLFQKYDDLEATDENPAEATEE